MTRDSRASKPSRRARMIGWVFRVVIKRGDWGDVQRMARWARRILHLLPTRHHALLRGQRLERVRNAPVQGEWILPRQRATSNCIILYFHGGGYVACNAATHRPISCALAAGLGARVFSLDYRLAPEEPFPAAVEDALAAYRWMLEACNDAPTSIAIAGDSAGGGLVLATLLGARDAGLPQPACAACICAWTDMTGSGASLTTNAESDDILHPDNIPPFAAAYLGGADPRNPLASQVFADLTGLPPLLLQVSDSEILLDDSVRIHERAQQAGVNSTLSIYHHLPHDWPLFVGFMPEASDALKEVCAFISRHISETCTGPVTADRASTKTSPGF